MIIEMKVKFVTLDPSSSKFLVPHFRRISEFLYHTIGG
jgi:hypothetical protein